MVFRTDRQRKGFFASRGRTRSNVAPEIQEIQGTVFLKRKQNVINRLKTIKAIKNKRQVLSIKFQKKKPFGFPFKARIKLRK